MGLEIESFDHNIVLPVAADRIYIVSAQVPGIVAADALDANDAIGSKFELVVPKYGIIEGFKLIDLDDDTLALTAHLFSKDFVAAASDAAFTISAADAANWITSVTFDAAVGIGAAKVAEEAGSSYYYAPEGKLFVQCSTTGTPTIAANLSPILIVCIRVSDGVAV